MMIDTFFWPMSLRNNGSNGERKGRFTRVLRGDSEPGTFNIGANIQSEDLRDKIELSRSSTLLNWLYLRGPYNIMEFIEENFGITIPEKHELGGNCEACSVLFGRSEIYQ